MNLIKSGIQFSSKHNSIINYREGKNENLYLGIAKLRR